MVTLLTWLAIVVLINIITEENNKICRCLTYGITVDVEETEWKVGT